jgi:hypothetical protein
MGIPRAPPRRSPRPTSGSLPTPPLPVRSRGCAGIQAIKDRNAGIANGLLSSARAMLGVQTPIPQVAEQKEPLKAAPPANASKPKPCGGGQCRHRADCADRYCPGRLSASLTGAHRP